MTLFETLFAGLATRRRLDAGETLFRSGDPVRFLYVIAEGKLRLLRRGIAGNEVTVHRARAGESFAEASLFAERYHCDALAEISSELLAYPKPAVVRGLTEQPERMLMLLAHFASQIQALRSQAEILNLRTATDRLMAYFRLYPSTGGDRLVIDQTWKQLASELGLTHEAVYRALARLERDGAIQRDGVRVRLLR